MLICKNCGKVIKEEDLSTHKDFLAYVGEEKYYETNADNCFCGGEFEEAVKCDCCKEYCLDNDITWGWRYNIKVCRACIDFYKGKYSSIYNRLTLNGEDDFIDWLSDKGEISNKGEQKMIRDSNIQKSIVLSKELWGMLSTEAKKQYYGTTGQLIRKILADYIKNKGKETL